MHLTTEQALEKFRTGQYEVVRQRSFGGSDGSYYLAEKSGVWYPVRRTIGKKLFEESKANATK